MESFSFGDNAVMADELLGLVLKGQKTATCWAAIGDAKKNEVGTRMIVKDGKGNDCAVVETVECFKLKFKEADASFAFDEGEGDRSLEYWRKAHKEFFTREGTYSEDMEVYCERFKLTKIL